MYPTHYMPSCDGGSGPPDFVEYKEKGAPHAWKKMVQVRDEVEYNIWWTLKAGKVNFLFDNWTKQRTFNFLKDDSGEDEDMEVTQFIRNGQSNLQKLKLVIQDEMVEHIMENISPRIMKRGVDRPWNFSMNLVFKMLRRKKEKQVGQGICLSR